MRIKFPLVIIRAILAMGNPKIFAKNAFDQKNSHRTHISREFLLIFGTAILRVLVEIT